MQQSGATFGEVVRASRQSKGLKLRKFAAKVDMTPSYLSKIESGKFPPPREEKVAAIAEALEQDRDELLALAGRIATDVKEVILRRPKIASVVRMLRHSSTEELDRLAAALVRRRRG